MHKAPLFDYRGILLKQLLRNSNTVAYIITNDVANKRVSHDTHLYELLWKQDCYLENITIAVDTLIPFMDTLDWVWVGEDLLHAADTQHKATWLRYYIEENSRLEEKIKGLFKLIAWSSSSDLNEALMFFCKCNPSYDLFAQLPLLPTTMTWSGSEIPIVEQRIKALEALRASLAGVEYLRHRNRINERILSLKGYLGDVALNEFMAQNDYI